MRPTPHLDRLVATLAFSVLAGTTGCFRVVTEEVLVRDPHQVSVLRADGTTTLPAGAERATAVQGEGVYWRLFTPTPYRVVAERDTDGSLSLRCEGCASDRWANVSSPTLMTADGALQPATRSSWSASAVTLGADEIDLRVRTCLLTSKGKGRCRVGAEALLATPRENVVEIRSRRSTFQPVGGLLLGFGVLPMLAGATVAAGVMGRGLSTRDRALVATPLLGVGAAFSATGIWHLTAPVEERVIHPGAGSE